jgi:predicted unusual protein kinase regulating ubiquinone biosynthesis (AarF/ABC1/UbiB family)
LSIRTDLIPEAYALELRQLQDAVPAFDSDEARAIIARELKTAPGAAGLHAVFKALSPEPLAAASIGQVYKGTLKDGRQVATKPTPMPNPNPDPDHDPYSNPNPNPTPSQVAVKVQRPGILDEIALDLYVLRLLAPLQVRVRVRGEGRGARGERLAAREGRGAVRG